MAVGGPLIAVSFRFSGLDDELDISPEAEEDEFRKLPTDGTLPDSESQVGGATGRQRTAAWVHCVCRSLTDTIAEPLIFLPLPQRKLLIRYGLSL